MADEQQPNLLAGHPPASKCFFNFVQVHWFPMESINIKI